MSLEHPLPFVEKLNLPTMKFRYFAYNCFEIKLPTGKTLVIDPCIEKEGRFNCGYDVNDLEGCDYVFVNHTHGDHVASLGKVYDKFEPIVLAHSAVAFDLANVYDIAYRMVIPFESGQTYDFGDFKIQILPGRHNDIGRLRPSGHPGNDSSSLYSSAKKIKSITYSSELEKQVSDMGTMFNHNFLMTLPNNLRVGFFAGSPGMSINDEYQWRQLQPDIILAHRARWGYPNWQEQMAHVLEVTGAQLMIPIHFEDAYRNVYDPEEYVTQVNALCEQKNILGRMMFPQRGKWYELATSVTLL